MHSNFETWLCHSCNDRALLLFMYRFISASTLLWQMQCWFSLIFLEWKTNKRVLARWGKGTFKKVEDAILLSAEYEYECSSLVAKYLSHGIKRFHSLSWTSQQLQALLLSKQNAIPRFKTIKLSPVSALCDFICCQLHLYWCLLMTA